MQFEEMVRASEGIVSTMTADFEAMRDERDQTRTALTKVEELFEGLAKRLNLVLATTNPESHRLVLSVLVRCRSPIVVPRSLSVVVPLAHGTRDSLEET